MKRVRVLLVEDSEDDFLLVRDALQSAGFAPAIQRVENPAAMRQALAEAPWDVVLSDYNMPEFDALSALSILKESKQREVPFVIVSGSIGEMLAVSALKAGAADYVMKENLDKLGPVVVRELSDAQTRQERHDAIEALRQAVRARDEFIAIASHELKTPLTALDLQLQRLIRSLQHHDEKAPLETQRLLGQALAAMRSSTRLHELVQHLLSITEISTGSLSLMRAQVDLTALVNTVCGRLGDVFRNAGCALSVRAPPSVIGCWDTGRLDMVVANLCTNAAKFGAGKPIVIELEQDDNAAFLRVIDRGIGIAAADQQRILEKFERAVSKQNYGGFGVVLWVSNQIVQAHGGAIAVTSAPDAGSTFTVMLPKQLGSGQS